MKRDGAIHFLADRDLNFLFVIVIFKNDEQFFFSFFVICECSVEFKVICEPFCFV